MKIIPHPRREPQRQTPPYSRILAHKLQWRYSQERGTRYTFIPSEPRLCGVELALEGGAVEWEEGLDGKPIPVLKVWEVDTIVLVDEMLDWLMGALLLRQEKWGLHEGAPDREARQK
jgi:hypothetical protein